MLQKDLNSRGFNLVIAPVSVLQLIALMCPALPSNLQLKGCWCSGQDLGWQTPAATAGGGRHCSTNTTEAARHLNRQRHSSAGCQASTSAWVLSTAFGRGRTHSHLLQDTNLGVLPTVLRFTGTDPEETLQQGSSPTEAGVSHCKWKQSRTQEATATPLPRAAIHTAWRKGKIRAFW